MDTPECRYVRLCWALRRRVPAKQLDDLMYFGLGMGASVGRCQAAIIIDEEDDWQPDGRCGQFFELGEVALNRR